jgi:hypothetical protein
MQLPKVRWYHWVMAPRLMWRHRRMVKRLKAKRIVMYREFFQLLERFNDE